MRYHQIAQEAENGTKESKQIVDTLINAGYTQIGEGMESTIWTKDSGTAIKIIMPEEIETMTQAARTFYKFYEFCQQNSNFVNLPKFVSINGDHHATFKIGNKEYIQVAMERLYPLERDNYREAMVWMLSDFATKRMQWQQVYNKLIYPETWINWDGPQSPEEIAEYVYSLDNKSLAEYKLLYTLMTVLYHTGRINKLGWDLHTDNVMQRKDGTLVIIDPWFFTDEFED